MRPVRIGGLIGAALLVVVFSTKLGFPTLDPIALIGLAVVGIFGAALGAGSVRSWQNLHRTPGLPVRVGLILVLATVAVLIRPWKQEAEAKAFLAVADSTHGVVTWRDDERKGLGVRYVTASGSYFIRGLAKRGQDGLMEGDTLTVYFDPMQPSQGVMGRPGPDWRTKWKHLAAVLVLSGVLLSGYLPDIVVWSTTFQRGRWSAT